MDGSHSLDLVSRSITLYTALTNVLIPGQCEEPSIPAADCAQHARLHSCDSDL